MNAQFQTSFPAKQKFAGENYKDSEITSLINHRI